MPTINAEMLEHLLLYSTLSKLKPSKQRYRNVYKPLTNFTVDFSEGADGEYMGSGENCQGIFIDVKPRDLTKDLNAAVIGSNEDVQNAYEGFVIHHGYRVPMKQIRGLPFNPYPVALTTYSVNPRIEEAEVDTFLVYYTPRKIITTEHGTQVNNWSLIRRYNSNSLHCRMPLGDTNRELNDTIQATLGYQFSARYDWYVLIGFEDLPKLKMSVNPKSVRQLFEIKKIKDPIEGRRRLIHWVVDHWRRKPRRWTEQDSAEESEQWVHVCEHLRGYYEFEWHGLNCWLIPSEYDRERLLPHLKHAEVWA